MHPESRWPGWADTLLGWACEALAVCYYVGYVLPRCAWLTWTGQIPSPPPARTRLEARCHVCGRPLAQGTVYCPDHPQAEVSVHLSNMKEPPHA